MLQMALRLFKVSFRQIETDGRKARLGLLDKFQKTPSAAADIEKLQKTLIAAGENLKDRR